MSFAAEHEDFTPRRRMHVSVHHFSVGCVPWFGLREQVKCIRRVHQAEEQFIDRGRA